MRVRPSMSMVPGWAWAWTHQCVAGFLAHVGSWQQEAATQPTTGWQPKQSTPLDLPGVVELHNNPGSLGPVDALQVRHQPLILGRAVLVVGPPVEEERKSAWQAMILWLHQDSHANKVGYACLPRAKTTHT